MRKHCLELRNQIDPDLKHQYDARIIAGLLKWLEDKCPERPSDAWLALWWPIGSEPDWRNYAPALRMAGWRLALPCVIAPDQALGFAQFEESTVMRRAAMGIYEPLQPLWIQPWVVTAPCLGFWKAYRLGYGGGFYDRSMALLDESARARCAAIAYSKCEISFQPKQNDIAFGTVITEQSISLY